MVGPGTIVTIVYEGDSDDDAERYLVGHIEEKTDDLDVVSPTAPLGAALHRRTAPATRVEYEAPTGASCGSGSSRWRRPDRARRADASTPSWRRSTTSPSRPRRARAAAGRDVELPGRARSASASSPARPARRRSCCSTAGRRRPTSTSSRATRPLGEHFRVLAFDHRGHGRGIRSRAAFRLEDCADDVAALLDALGARAGRRRRLLDGRRRRPAAVAPPPGRVRGLVLAATAAQFKARCNDRLSFLGLARPRPRSPG